MNVVQDLSASTVRRLRIVLYAVMLALAALVVAGPVGSWVARAIDPPTAVVSGVVFDDRDGDGERDEGERGVAGVSVSDGVDIVQTDDAGRYSLEISTDRRRTDQVFVTQPAGWSVGVNEFMTPRFYRDLGQLADDDTVTVDFDLTRKPGSQAANFSFGNIADPHINAQLPDQIREINSTSREMGFIQVSGDLTNRATDAEFERYKAAVAQSDLPVWPAVGNHEYFSGGGSDYASRIDNYRRHVGPEWYSFDYGNRHFIVLENNGQAPFDEQIAWAERDLELNAGGDKRLVVLTHQPMNVPFGSPSTYDRYGELLERYGAELILVGHEHSNDVEPDSAFAGTAKHVQTSSSSYTIDNSPRGFRYVHMSETAFENPFRMYGADQTITITSPAPGVSTPLDNFPGIQVNAYDTADEVREVRYRVDGGPWRPLRSTGEFTWHSPLIGPAAVVGDHTIDVRATDRAGNRWTESATFTLTDDPAVVPRAGADWTQHHGDSAHTGVAADAQEPGRRLAWSYRTEGSFLTGSPIIVDGVVYAGTRDENGDGNSAVHAVDLATGQELWTFPVPSSVHGSLAAGDGLIFVPSLRGTLFAVDAATGELRWQRDVEEAPEPNNQRAYGYYSPAVADGIVYWPYQTRYGAASQGLLTALDTRTGDTVWEAPMSGATMSDGTPAITDGTVFVGSQTADRVLAYDAATGERLWMGTESLGGWQDGIPAAADGRVFIGSNNGIVARDAETGQTLWSYRSPHPSKVSSGSTPSAPALVDDLVIMGFPSGAVTALDARTGAVIWDRLLPGDTYTGGIASSPAVAGDTVFVGSNNGMFYALDVATGQPRWEYEIGTWVAAGPAVSGNTVVTGAWDGNLYAFTPGGEAAPRWATVEGTVLDAATADPVDGARIVATTSDGAVVSSTTTRADGNYVVGLAPGTYTMTAAKRGHVAGDDSSTTVEVGPSGEVRADLALTAVTEPIAGRSDVAPDFGTGSTRIDVRPGDDHHFVMNDRLVGTIVSHTAGNDQAGTFRPGWLADLALTDATGMETLDWSELILAPAMNDPARPWNRSGEWLDLGDVSVDGDSIVAAGSAQVDDDLRTSVRYRALPDAPVVKLTLEIENTGADDFSGYFQYLLDPDSSSDVARVPGLPGTNPGFVRDGWTGNYVYVGAQSVTGQPAHAVAWAPGDTPDQPTGITAFGYIAGAWFDASVPAGATRTISWYHITDYPAADDPTANIARWAGTIDLLDPEVPDRSRVSGTITDADTGSALSSVAVELLDAAGAVVSSGTTDTDGSYAIAADPGTYTLRVPTLGYATSSRDVTIDEGTTTTMDVALDPVVVEAGTGKRLIGSLVEAGRDDVVIENSRLAMAVSRAFDDPQLSGSTTGKPVDLAVQGRADQLDWLNLPYVVDDRPTGTEAWQQRTVVTDDVEIMQVTGDRAVVRAVGRSSVHDEITVETTYTVEPDQPWVQADTVIANDGDAPLSVWIGDAIDHDGAGQHSGVAGVGAIRTPYSSPDAYAPTGRWIGMAGTDPQTYGLIYDGDVAFDAYGNGNWIMSRAEVSIPAGGEYTMSRRIVAVDNGGVGDPFGVLDTLVE